LELIGRTVLDGERHQDRRGRTRLPVEVAFKRRQRVEARIAAFYRIISRRRASGRTQPTEAAPR
jgi:hypothetical protein